MFTHAQKNQTNLKLCISGPSGSGKTYSSLLIAKGLATLGKIAVLDSEAKSSALYSDLVSFDVAELKSPFTVERYVDCINEAEKLGYEVLIVDSLSHVWIGEGGLLDLHNKATKSTGNSFTAWNEVTPHYNKLIQKIHQAGIHLICCMRAKSQYVVEDKSNGKKVPRKVGLEPEFRPGGLYEFDITLALDYAVAKPEKDRSGVFRGEYFTPSVETGQRLHTWLSGGSGNGDNGGKDDEQETEQQQPKEAKQEQVIEFPSNMSRTYGEALTELARLMREVGIADKMAQYEVYLREKYGKALKDLKLDELEYQVANLQRCMSDEKLRRDFRDFLDNLKAA